MPTAPTEDDARPNIDRMLANAGWSGAQITRGRAKHDDQRKALGGLKPDYVLYASGMRSALAVVEAKKEGVNLKAALQQGLKYAKRLRCNIVFASDGNIVATAHARADGAPLMTNDTAVSSFLREQHLLHFRESNVWHRGEGFAASGDLVKLFNSARAQLNKDGIAQMGAFHEFAKLIFVKILSELHEEDKAMFRKIPARWGDIEHLAGETLMGQYRKVLRSLNEEYQGGFEGTEIRSPEVLEALVGLVASRSFVDTGEDVKGEAYEYFLRDHARVKDGLNRYFTPRHIVKMMVLLLNPKPGEKVYDPFCGTGGMLIEAFRHVRQQLPSGEEQRRALKQLRLRSLYGCDISDTAHIAKMNMILSGDGHSNIKRGDSTIHAPVGKYDVVVTNIPFDAEREVKYIRTCLNAVRGQESGRAAIIVPERIIREARYAKLREGILAEWNVERVVSLPRYVFAEYTNAKTSVLCVSWRGAGEKGKKSFPVYKIVRDGLKGSLRRRPDPEPPNDIQDMLAGDFAPRETTPSAPGFFFNSAGAAPIIIRKGHKAVKVGDVISPAVRARVEIKPDMLCLEPGFDGREHRIDVKKRKRFSQVAKSGRRRLPIEKGDLVIAMMHTQDGLIAFSESDDTLHSTGTHVPFKVDEKKVDKRYLFWTLRGILMTMERDDVVGRENFTVGEILALPFPLPPMAEQRKIGKAMDRARQKIWDAESALEKSRAAFAAAEKRMRTFDAD